jgi:drug/metabolite transporter (DMT)-like permease
VETQPSPTPQATPDGSEIFAIEDDAGLWDLLLGLLGVMVIGGTGYYVARVKHQPTYRSLRVALWAVIGGLTLYLAYALRLPGAPWLREQTGIWAAAGATLLGGAVPLIVAWIVERRRRSTSKSS